MNMVRIKLKLSSFASCFTSTLPPQSARDEEFYPQDLKYKEEIEEINQRNLSIVVSPY